MPTRPAAKSDEVGRHRVVRHAEALFPKHAGDHAAEAEGREAEPERRRRRDRRAGENDGRGAEQPEPQPRPAAQADPLGGETGGQNGDDDRLQRHHQGNDACGHAGPKGQVGHAEIDRLDEEARRLPGAPTRQGAGALAGAAARTAAAWRRSRTHSAARAASAARHREAPPWRRHSRPTTGSRTPPERPAARAGAGAPADLAELWRDRSCWTNPGRRPGLGHGRRGHPVAEAGATISGWRH